MSTAPLSPILRQLRRLATDREAVCPDAELLRRFNHSPGRGGLRGVGSPARADDLGRLFSPAA
jgi:hypothetical protein